jgi:hypothetical protein
MSGEETEGVRVGLEGLDNSESAVEVGGIVRGPRRGAVNGLASERRVYIKQHVHASGIEDTGTLIVVEIGVKVVDADGVDSQILQQSSITLADIAVRKRILAPTI